MLHEDIGAVVACAAWPFENCSVVSNRPLYVLQCFPLNVHDAFVRVPDGQDCIKAHPPRCWLCQKVEAAQSGRKSRGPCTRMSFARSATEHSGLERQEARNLGDDKVPYVTS